MWKIKFDNEKQAELATKEWLKIYFVKNINNVILKSLFFGLFISIIIFYSPQTSINSSIKAVVTFFFASFGYLFATYNKSMGEVKELVKNEYLFNEENVTITQESTELKFSYSNFSTAYEKQKYIFLRLKPVGTIIIPKSTFKDQEDTNNFINFIKSKLTFKVKIV